MLQGEPGSLRVIGTGLPRTGTTSLKGALEQLLDAPCYHMVELFEAEHAGLQWFKALQGDHAELPAVLSGYRAAVDWPASLFWRELIEAHSEALVIHSHRGDAKTWWESADRTVWAAMRRPDIEQAFPAFNVEMRNKAGFGADWDDAEIAMARYNALHDEVVATVPAERLLIWQPGDGWEPLCAALGVPVPQQDFFHHNTTAEFRARGGFD